jgi:hypothetical protein
MTRLAILAAIVAVPAFAKPVEDLSGSTVTLRATDAPGAVAEVVFWNQDTNGPQDNRGFTLSAGGFTVDFRFHWQSNPDGDDAVWIAPPDGYRAEPDYLVCPEMRTCVALIFPQQQVGM